MPFILSGNVGSATAATGFDVDNSLMFDKASSAYMTRSAAGSGATKATFSFWVKRSKLADTQIIHNFYSASDSYNKFYFDGNDRFIMKQQVSSTTQIQIMPSRRFRDMSSWYHIVYIVDPTESTEANRVKVYVNGVQESSFGTETYPAEDALVRVEYAQYVGREYTDDTKFFDGYLAEFVFLDGVAAAIGDLGVFDEDSGIWKPIDVSGLTFGSRGFYLDFKDSGNLGDDESGNENDFTESGIAATDQGIDTCTNNFATLNPLIQGTSNNARTFSEGNTTVVLGRDSASVSSIGVSAGKWYVEIKCITDAANPVIFIAEEGSPATVNPYGGTNGVGVKEFGYVNDGKKKGNAGDFTSYGATWTAGNIISMAYDADNGTLWFAKNGAWQASATKTEIENGTTTNAAFTGLSGLFFFGCCDAATGTGDKFSCNFGSPYFAISSGNADGDGFGNFEYEVPSGYFALCTKNLAEYGG